MMTTGCCWFPPVSQCPGEISQGPPFSSRISSSKSRRRFPLPDRSWSDCSRCRHPHLPSWAAPRCAGCPCCRSDPPRSTTLRRIVHGCLQHELAVTARELDERDKAVRSKIAPDRKQLHLDIPDGRRRCRTAPRTSQLAAISVFMAVKPAPFPDRREPGPVVPGRRNPGCSDRCRFQKRGTEPDHLVFRTFSSM
jgi:hypothetical protein